MLSLAVGLSVVGDEGLAGFVGVETCGSLAVCAVDVVDGGFAGDADEGVESGVWSFMGDYVVS